MNVILHLLLYYIKYFSPVIVTAIDLYKFYSFSLFYSSAHACHSQLGLFALV